MLKAIYRLHHKLFLSTSCNNPLSSAEQRFSNAQRDEGGIVPLPASPRKPVTPAPRSRLRRPPALSGRFWRRAGCYPSPPFPRPVRGLWRRSGRSGRPVCGGCVRWRWSAAADKMVKVLKAKTRYQHHSGLWPPDSSPAISPARIAAKPFLPYCGLPENEAVGAGDFTGGALLCEQCICSHKCSKWTSSVTAGSPFLLVGAVPQTP